MIYSVEVQERILRGPPIHLKCKTMLSGIILLWFILTGISLLYVAIDILRTPESPVLKLGFVLLTAYTGPVGAFLYVLGCREPLPGLHERYTASRWRQVLGSTMHCVAGDGLGILIGAFIGGMMEISMPYEIALEYFLGFGLGWTIFQALFMKASEGGTFGKALKNTFIPELVSMNYLMAAMMVVNTIGRTRIAGSDNPLNPEFWFLMSMALLTGFVAAYPINWWLVSNHLKHGMMTVRPPASAASGDQQEESSGESMKNMENRADKVSTKAILWMVILSFAVLALGIVFAFSYPG